VRPGDVIRFMSNQANYKVEEVGIFRLSREPRDRLSAGEVGYIISGVKTVSDTRIGDTITLHSNPAAARSRIQGCEAGRVLFLYPMSSEDYPPSSDSWKSTSSTTRRSSIRKIPLRLWVRVSLRLSRPASPGDRPGATGKEYDQAFIMTVPSVQYQFTLQDGSTISVDNPQYYQTQSPSRALRNPTSGPASSHPNDTWRHHEALPGAPGSQFPLQLPCPGRLEILFDMPWLK